MGWRAGGPRRLEPPRLRGAGAGHPLLRARHGPPQVPGAARRRVQHLANRHFWGVGV